MPMPIRCLPLLLPALFTACDTRPPLVLNEFMADNVDDIVAGYDGEHYDWIEIHNTGDEQVSLEGLFLTDDLDYPTQHALDASLGVAGDGFLLLWASNAGIQEPNHLNFKLSADGEELGLFWLDPATENLSMLDGIVFSAQRADISMARDEDGIGAWTLTDQPTPGASNQ